MPEVVLRLDAGDHVVFLHDEPRGGRDDHFELGPSILLHLERAGRGVVPRGEAHTVLTQRRSARKCKRRVDGAELIYLERLTEHNFVVGINRGELEIGSIERLQRVSLAPANDPFDVNRVTGPVDRLVGVDVADQLALRLAEEIGARIRGGDLPAAVRERHEILVLFVRESRVEHTVSARRSTRDRLLIGEHLHVAAALRFAGQPIGGEDEHLTGRDLRDNADVRDDDDGVGAQKARYRFDDVDTRLLDLDGHTAHVGIAIVGQQLAPGGNELIGVEQRHLRKGRAVERYPLRDLLCVARAAALGAILVRHLIAEKLANAAAILPLPVGDALDAASLRRDRHVLTAELMRIAKAAEELDRISHPVDAEIQLSQMAEGEVERRTVLRSEDLAARQAERRSGLWFGVALRGHRNGDREKGGKREQKSDQMARHRRVRRKAPMNCLFVGVGRHRGEGWRNRS